MRSIDRSKKSLRAIDCFFLSFTSRPTVLPDQKSRDSPYLMVASPLTMPACASTARKLGCETENPAAFPIEVMFRQCLSPFLNCSKNCSKHLHSPKAKEEHKKAKLLSLYVLDIFMSFCERWLKISA